MNAFANELSAHPGNKSKVNWKCAISSLGSSFKQMVSVSSPSPQVPRACFQSY